MMNRGIDITKPFNNMLDWFANLFASIKDFKLPKRAPKPKAKKWEQGKNTPNPSQNNSDKSSQKATASPEDQAELDRILDKIKKSGYTALSADEKKRLFDVSSRIK